MTTSHRLAAWLAAAWAVAWIGAAVAMGIRSPVEEQAERGRYPEHEDVAVGKRARETDADDRCGHRREATEAAESSPLRFRHQVGLRRAQRADRHSPGDRGERPADAHEQDVRSQCYEE